MIGQDSLFEERVDVETGSRRSGHDDGKAEHFLRTSTNETKRVGREGQFMVSLREEKEGRDETRSSSEVGVSNGRRMEGAGTTYIRTSLIPISLIRRVILPDRIVHGSSEPIVSKDEGEIGESTGDSFGGLMGVAAKRRIRNNSNKSARQFELRLRLVVVGKRRKRREGMRLTTPLKH